METIQSKSYPYHLVLGVVGSDVHCIANQLLEKDLNWHDFQVTNLGVALSPTEVLDSVRKLANPVLLPKILKLNRYLVGVKLSTGLSHQNGRL